ncbi:MAG: hypothetical protein IT182_14870 [Acidobacteria bacterium]|nr:hypothetical protein [Acidobacteriota bacterium]
MAKRRWVTCLVGVLLLLAVGVVALAGSCAYVVRQQVRVTPSSSLADFEHEAAGVLARFKDVPPLIEDGPAGPAVSRKALAARSKHGGAVAHMRILVFSTHEHKLVRLSLPMWLLRMSPDGSVDFKSDELDFDKVHLSISDLELAGPGPLYVRSHKDSHVLVWTE